MERKVEVRTEKAKIDLYANDQAPMYYTDGVGQFLLSPMVSKLLFMTTIGPNADGIEERAINVQIAMPTVSLLEMARDIVKLTQQNHAAMSSEVASSSTKIAQILEEIAQLKAK